MIILFVLIIQTIIHAYYCVTPDSICSIDKPFENPDKTCGDFNDVCVKKDDSLCNNFQAACKQCPPTNYTASMLTILKNQIDLSIQKIESFKDQCDDSKKKINALTVVINTSTVLSTIIICVIQILILLIIIKYRKIVKYCYSRRKHKRYDSINPEDSLLTTSKGMKSVYQNDIFNKILKLESIINQSIENLDRKFETKFQEIIDKIEPSKTPIKDAIIEIIQFQFDGIDQEPIELYVHNNHNIVQVKQQICAKLPHAKHDDFKIMKLKYNGIILNDNNQYLLEKIDLSNKVVNCFIDSSMNTSDIVVVKLQGKMRLPDIIQINKNQTTDQLEELIGKIINSKEYSLFKEILDDKIQMKKSLLKLDRVRVGNNLTDGDCIRIVQKVEGKLIIKSIFDEDVSITAAYKNTNQISSLIEFVKNANNWEPDYFVLFYNNQILQDNKYICEYGICEDSPVKICNIARIECVSKGKRCEAHRNEELYNATKPPNDTKILLKQYNNINLKNWKSQDWVINELKTFLVTEKHARFVQLFGVYFDENILYVAMENMEKGSLKHYIKKNKNFEKKLVRKWSEQIIEGLNFLHERNVVHRDLNPSNILVNNAIDLKLSSFNLSKYENIYGPSSLLKKPEVLEAVKVRYMAPELLKGEDYKFPCDIWSFGAVLVRIVSGKKPFPKMSKEELKKYIINDEVIEYDLSDNSISDSKLNSLIISCLKRKPSERCKIEEIKEIINSISD